MKLQTLKKHYLLILSFCGLKLTQPKHIVNTVGKSSLTKTKLDHKTYCRSVLSDKW